MDQLEYRAEQQHVLVGHVVEVLAEVVQVPPSSALEVPRVLEAPVGLHFRHVELEGARLVEHQAAVCLVEVEQADERSSLASRKPLFENRRQRGVFSLSLYIGT